MEVRVMLRSPSTEKDRINTAIIISTRVKP
jgi:hypothetical protein